MKKFIFLIVTLWYSLMANTTFAFSPPTDPAFSRQDTLRGSNGRGRSWWDVQHYNLRVSYDTANKSISGSNEIRAKIIAAPTDTLQLDLQEPMVLDSVLLAGKKVDFARENNVYWLKYPFRSLQDSLLQFTAYYHGSPRIARRPPWDGGFIWTKDSLGHPWIAVACQGLGASCWWPCKDYQGDEPDRGMEINVQREVVIALLIGSERSDCKSSKAIGSKEARIISNGSANVTGTIISDGKCSNITYENWHWKVSNPINTYNATFYIGDYVSWRDTLMGEKGKLDLSFYALRYHEEAARKQFAVVRQMLHCFEYWMGPYPFYEDGYKLVEAPYLGMEHQSAIAYGNQYKMGYLGMDRSGTGVGLLFDFIIIHESGHEWFGNNITAQDIADNWLHEGLTTYTEALFAECAFGKEKAYEYTRGQWKGIQNDRPVIGIYGVNNEGSGDEYDKGSAVIHMVRTIMNDDEKFRLLLRGLNKDFYHKIVTSKEVEDYFSRFAGYNFAPLFNQYLRTTDIPQFDYYIKKKKLFYRFKNVVSNFTLPLSISSEGLTETIYPTSEWHSIRWEGGYGFEISKDFLIRN